MAHDRTGGVLRPKGFTTQVQRTAHMRKERKKHELDPQFARQAPTNITEYTRAAIDNALKNGEALTPLEILMMAAHNENLDWDMRIRAATAAAPYIHPRLQHTTMEANVTVESQESRLRRLMEAAMTIDATPEDDD